MLRQLAQGARGGVLPSAIAFGVSQLATTTFVPRVREPAWHRRARSQRAQARTLLRLGKAAELLQGHHSAQRDMGKKAAGARAGNRSERETAVLPGPRQPETAVLPGPRKPEWGCSCGQADNWACRVRCLRCDRSAPQSILGAARAAARTWKAGKPAAALQGARDQQSRGDQAPLSFAEVVARYLPSVGHGSTERGSTGTSSAAPSGDVTMEPVASPDSPEARRLTQLRYWRERRAAAVRAGPLAEADVAECDGRIKELEQEALAARPWAARVQAATNARKLATDKRDKICADLAAARRAVQALEAEGAQAEAAVARTESALAAVQAEGAPRQPPAPADGLTPASVAAALDVLASAGAAMQQGGAGGAGGVGAAQLVEQLRALVSAAVGHGAGAAAHAGGAAVAEGGRAASAPGAPAADAAPSAPAGPVAGPTAVQPAEPTAVPAAAAALSDPTQDGMGAGAGAEGRRQSSISEFFGRAAAPSSQRPSPYGSGA